LKSLVKPIVYSVLMCFALGPRAAPKKSENPAPLVRMVELLGNPDRFSGEVVTVAGYLVIGGRNENADSALSIDKTDYENELGNGMGLVPNPEMLRDKRELTGMYVRITGSIVTHQGPIGRMLMMQNITECKVWSDPDHPRTLRQTVPTP
jgi:hypothetical protein